MKPRLVLACLMPVDVNIRARDEFDSVIVDGNNDMTVDEVADAAERHRADAIMFTNTLNLHADLIARLPASVRVGATSSVGFDHIDVTAQAAESGRDEYTRRANGMHRRSRVHDAACRRTACFSSTDRIMRQGWRYRIGQGDLLGVRVTGKTLGILGMGRIGQAMAQRARGFDMQIVYHARNRLPPELERGARFFGDFHSMLPHCHFLSVHAPAGPATDKMVGTKAFALLPDGAVFVNVSRGGLVDEDRLAGCPDIRKAVRRRSGCFSVGA